MINDDQGGIRNPYKCMNVMKQDTMDDKKKSEHTLTHVNLVIVKSHCTCTCIKSSKEYCVLCMKNIARLHKCQLVMAI